MAQRNDFASLSERFFFFPADGR